MNEQQITAKIELADDLYDRGQFRRAIEELYSILAEDPDHAVAHAFVADCLLAELLPAGARREAEVALALDPEHDYIHRVMGRVCVAEGQFRQARVHFNRAIEIDPDDSDSYVALYRSMVTADTHREQAGKELLERALALAPDDPDVLEECAGRALDFGQVDEAHRLASEALGHNAEHVHALLTMGQILLRQGDAESANEHARLVLRVQPDCERALELLLAVKTRKNPLLGLFWRYSVWMGSRGENHQIMVLVAGYLVSGLLTQILMDLGWSDWAYAVRLTWLAMCGYTWVAPAVLDYLLKRETQEVELDADY